MAVITLTFIPSANQIVSGFPETVTISTNISSTIYYTLDGTLPSLLSAVYTEPVKLPTDGLAVTLSAIAYYIDGMMNLVPSAILSNTYYTDQTDLDRTRWLFFEGVVYSYPGGLDIPLFYDANGDASYKIDVDSYDLELVYTSRNRVGDELGTDNEIDIMDPDETVAIIDNDIPEFSSPNSTDPFQASAKFILIDSRTGAPEQSVRLINGPHMSLRNSNKYWSGIDFRRIQGDNHISGGLTKIFYNREKGLMVAYYFDSAESRWVKSIGDLVTPEFSPNQPSVRFSLPLVFKWFNFGRQQMF